jgi:CubicO group peptidase (beta-lactamase class C family)
MRKLLLLFYLFQELQTQSQTLYFPPLAGNAWDTTSPASLGWCTERVDSLYKYLGEEKAKAFILLKDGKIVFEKYFGTFTQDSLWYWASAGKTLTAFLVGKAQEDKFLSINDASSKYLGNGWTDCTAVQEEKINIHHQLTMTTGLDDGVPDNHCTIDTCLKYLAEPGTRWAYHNAPYTLLEKVLTQSTGRPINSYTQSVLNSKTGITGFWFTAGYNNIFYSRARSMARFGLLAQNKFVWGTDSLLKDKNYISQMVNTSQEINYAYGYLWWLNGKGSYMVPEVQLTLPGSYAPSAPADMYAAIGKYGQIISIVPSKGLVMVRMGEDPDNGDVPFLVCENIWQRLNYVMCNNSVNKTYIFVGAGDWNKPINWSNGEVPPPVLPNGDQVIIYPFGDGECVLNVSQTIPSAGSIFIVKDKKIRITGNLVITQ